MHSLSIPLFILSSALLTTAYPSSPTYHPRPYKIDVPPSFIESTRQKASTFRPTPDIAPAWFDGPPSSNITALAKFWAEEYNWFADQDYINSHFSHFMTTVPPPGGNYTEPLDIHFIHQRSKRADAIPILLLHGWPSTSLEWEKIIPDLVDPKNDSQPAFHVVAPDLPGFGFSPAPKAPGFGPSEHSTSFNHLMTQLGYTQYAIYSTDLGVFVAHAMTESHPQAILTHISDFVFIIPNTTDLTRHASQLTTPEESRFITAWNAFATTHTGYSALHTTFPLSLAYALNDSPVGFLAWMYHIIYTVSDQVYTPAQLIREAFLLYLPGVYGNIRSYKELYKLENFAPRGVSRVPTAVLQFGSSETSSYTELRGVNFVPREWLDRSYANITYFARHEDGAHFPALSVPELVVADIRAVFA